MRKGTKFILITCFLLFGYAVISLIANQFDEELQTDFTSIHSRLVKTRITDGGEIRLGLFWKDENWQQLAKDIVSGKKSYETTPKEVIRLENAESCRSTNYLCNDEDFKSKNDAISKELEPATELLKRYEMLLNSKDYANPFEKTFVGQMTAFSNTSVLHQYYILSLNFSKPSERLQKLILETNYLERVLNNSYGLLDSAISIAQIKSNQDLILEVLKSEPQLKFKIPKNFLASFAAATPEQYIKEAIDGEVFALGSMIDLAKEPHPLETSSLSDNFSLYYWGRLFFMSNQTKNIVATFYRQMVEAKCWNYQASETCRQILQSQQALFSPCLTFRNQSGYLFIRGFLLRDSPYLVGLYNKIILAQDKARFLSALGR